MIIGTYFGVLKPSKVMAHLKPSKGATTVEEI